ncbi:THUMP-like domain-containing protein [Nocardia aurantia]|uniref:THUMP-like domain-containing protein n=1 Tax=Nocardia aurantia TaxID=2585199 RepID=A0A7K0DUS0_9NOCA|nr:class I SAM-dependent methyltransferase [Nocardia aurantia]MQY29496.1 hypothetical protein [Nocardia aurantia]
MGYRFSRADVGYLGGQEGVAALAAVDELPLTAASLVRDLERVRRDFGERAGVLVETVRLRRRAAVKLPGAEHWLFDDDALQQATPTVVAAHRARRLAGRAVHDVTCSVGAELAALQQVCPSVLGSDLDGVRLAMAAHNLGGASNVLLARADALAPCSIGTVVIADPARRADGRRTYDPAKLQPPLPDLIEAYAGRDLVVKCAPGIDFDSFLVGVPGRSGAPGGVPGVGARTPAAEQDYSGTGPAPHAAEVRPGDGGVRPEGGTFGSGDAASVRGAGEGGSGGGVSPLPGAEGSGGGRESRRRGARGGPGGSGRGRGAGRSSDGLGGMRWHGEVEVVSLDGSVREACLWSAGLATPGVTRRASVLSTNGPGWTITDAEPDDIPEREPGDWIVDPDGAVVRAGLVRHYAARHGLWQLDPRIAYLTGDRVPDRVRGFRILDRLDFREKALRAELQRRDCGPLEILTRGVDLDPDALRARLRPRGGTPLTLVVTRIGATPTVFLCETPSVTR